MADQEIKIVASTTVHCEGSEDAGGHPRVFIKLSEQTHTAKCPYCSQVFKLDSNAKVSGGH